MTWQASKVFSTDCQSYEFASPAHPSQRAKAQEGDFGGTPVTAKDIEPVAVAMQSSQGFRPETVGLILETISGWEVTSDRPFGSCTREELAAAALRNSVDDVEIAEILAAIDALILRGQDLEGEPLQHWEQERRPARLMTKPIVQIPDGTLRLLPWQSHGTWRVFQAYLGEGRSIWQAAGVPKALQDELAAFVHRRNLDLERDVAAELRKLTPHVKENIKKPKVLGLTSAEWANVGEIDAIAVDEATKTVWVAEAKDLFSPFSPSTVRRSYEKYFNSEDGYVKKLLKKTEMVRNNRIAVTASLGVDSSPEDWHVEPVMVTRRTEPAGFARSSPVPFCALGTLVQFILAKRSV